MLFQFQIQNWLSDVLGVPFLRFEFHAIVYQNHLIDSAHKIFFKNKNKIVVASVLFFIFIIKEKKATKKQHTNGCLFSAGMAGCELKRGQKLEITLHGFLKTSASFTVRFS